MLKRPHLPADAVSQARLFHALRQPVPETERRGAFFTRATSQSPCLHETLAAAAITIRNPRSALLMAIIQKEGVHMSLKYTCPVCGTPLGYNGLCWKCRSEQERDTVLHWSPEQVKEKQDGLVRNIRRLADMEDPCLLYTSPSPRDA